MIRSDRNPAGLSAIGFGAWEAGGGGTWGPNTSTDGVVEAVHAAFDAGVNWIDTAEVYGGGGGSERVVGQAIAGRTEVKVCTKVAPEQEDHFTAKGMRAALEDSLVRLGRDRVDVYLLHWPAESVPLSEAWTAITALKAEGLVGAVGLSNFPAADVEACAASGELDYVQVQGSLLFRDELTEFGPICERYGVGLMAYGSLGYGLLSGTLDSAVKVADWRGGEVGADDFFCAENYARFFAQDARRGHETTIDLLRHVADEDGGMSLARMALAWMLAQPAVTTALVGTRSTTHAIDNASAAEATLTDSCLRRIAAVLDRPGS